MDRIRNLALSGFSPLSNQETPDLSLSYTPMPLKSCEKKTVSKISEQKKPAPKFGAGTVGLKFSVRVDRFRASLPHRRENRLRHYCASLRHHRCNRLLRHNYG